MVQGIGLMMLMNQHFDPWFDPCIQFQNKKVYNIKYPANLPYVSFYLYKNYVMYLIIDIRIAFNLSIVFLKSLWALEKCNEIYFDLKLSFYFKFSFLYWVSRKEFLLMLFFMSGHILGSIVITLKLTRDSDDHLAVKTKFHIKNIRIYRT